MFFDSRTLRASLRGLTRGATFFVAGLAASFSGSALAEVTFEKEIKISDRGLFFDGEQVADGTPNRPKYDYRFGNQITPHGDAIKEYEGFVFMTWYRGGEGDRHVMLSRYNPNTGAVKTIEFPHRHTGFLNQPHIGESHNTIAVGIAPKDGTIHLLYDMHAYSEDRPAPKRGESTGAFANDYFRYSYSMKNAATVPDNQFTLDLFVNSNSGNYKHLEMRSDVDYRALTYPNFFTNKEGDLFMWIREGGNTNGAYKFARYNGRQWSKFTQFNVMDAKRRPNVADNWGLYGDIKFENGKMRIGFSRRSGNKNDKYKLNNGHYYAYTDDPLGASDWKDHLDRPITIPVYNPEPLKISEPNDKLNASGKDSINMTSGTDWVVSKNESIHMVTEVKTTDRSQRLNVHTYKKAGERTFKTSTDFPGGNLYTFENDVYLIGLGGGRVFIERTDAGTNNWQRIYSAPRDSRQFRHGVVHISKGKLYYYLMEQKTGSAQPIYLQIFDLGFGQTTPPAEPPVDLKDLAPEGFNFGAYENDMLAITRPVDIAFGREGVFSYRTNVRSNTECRRSICDKDPVPGERKACYVREAKTPYNERFIAAPGTLEAEHFDYGGNGVSYSDSSPELNKGAQTANFRADEGVDITAGNGGYAIGWTGDDEWVEYTIYAHKAGLYKADIIASALDAGEITIMRDGTAIANNIAIEATGSEDNYQSNTTQIRLNQGVQRLRVNFNKGGFNFDKIILTEVAQ